MCSQVMFKVYTMRMSFLGFLWQLLCEVARVCGSSTKPMAVQTDPISLPPPSSLGMW